VESPTKAKTLARYVQPVLGSRVKVKASFGHVRDLPESKLAVDVERNFEPTYEIKPGSKKVIGELRSAAKGAENVWLATDLDREGEGIAWHVAQALGLANGKVDDRVRRVTFSEITPEAIEQAFREPRAIHQELVDAYQARRVWDRLVGYTLSPLLWKKVRRGLSAGRVQSVALRLVVDREREIQAFVPREYWSIETTFATQAHEKFGASVLQLRGEKLEIESEAQATEHVEGVRNAGEYKVSEVRRKERRVNPAAPFTTSTLQQEASRKLGFTARRTMAVAQQLYEGVDLGPEGQVGLITYMRTDSVNLAPSAVQEIRAYIGERFGEKYLPASPRTFKARKGAQEAHEAIRPTHATRAPEQIARYLDNDQARLYRLIWERAIACQMTEALFDQTSVDIAAGEYLLRATGQIMLFDGFRRLYLEGRDDEDDPDSESRLPTLEAGQPLTLEDIVPSQHFTQPPPRYTEATLVKALEDNGIGRPSTYATYISTLVEREYARVDNRRIFPEDIGFVVCDLLVDHFPQIVDAKFTAEMEEDLDEIAQGHKRWADVLRQFYDPFARLVEKKELEINRDDLVKETTDELCPVCGGPMNVKLGRWGKFLSCANYPECKGTRQLSGKVRPDPVEVPGEVCEECGAPMLLRHGRYGEFLGCSRFPECKHVRPKAIGGFCPKCREGKLVERRTKKRRSFYGCSRYPDCDYTLWTRPLDEPCPKCGGTMTPSEDKAVCLSCGHTVTTAAAGASSGA
jgi:DNA topoisomerase-1